MSTEMKKWSSDQVVEAFRQFRNPDATTDHEKADNQLRDVLKKSGKEFFESKDIFSIAGQFVPAHCSGKLAMAVVDYLD